jgi:hypothetical protein
MCVCTSTKWESVATTKILLDHGFKATRISAGQQLGCPSPTRERMRTYGGSAVMVVNAVREVVECDGACMDEH